MLIYQNITKCRVCGSKDLEEVLQIPEQYIGAIFVKDNENHQMSKIKVPMTLMLCSICKLVQLKETTNPDLLYRDYYYRTDINDTMKHDLQELVNSTLKRVVVNKDDIVIDIGSNDCTMLGFFPDYLNRFGVEPAKNINWKNVDKSISIINDYFTKENVVKKIGNKKAKIITSCAMFYDLNDPNKAVQDIKELLDDDGICVIQVSYLLDTIRDFNVYDICHEHLEYYSFESFNHLMKQNGMYIFDAEMNFVNGGSIRFYISHDENKRLKNFRVLKQLQEEKKYNLDKKETYDEFGDKIERIKKCTRDFILNEIENGGKVIGLGASTKANVLIQLFNLNKDIMPVISERSKIKIGLRTLGTDIPLISEEDARKLNSSVMICFPYNFKNEIIQRENEYLRSGGKLMFILPTPYIVYYENRVFPEIPKLGVKYYIKQIKVEKYLLGPDPNYMKQFLKKENNE